MEKRAITNSVHFSKTLINLKSVEYIKLRNALGTYKVKVSENISKINVTKESFELDFSRKIILEPDGFFELEVNFNMFCQFDETSKKIFDGDLEKINSFIEKNKLEIIINSNLCSQSTLLIAQITSFNNLSPIVLPVKPIQSLKD